MTATDLDVAPDFDSVRQRHSRLGTGAMIVISEGTSIVRKFAEYIEFFAAGSCGQCPPCKCGTFQMARLLGCLDTGNGTVDDLRALRNLCGILPGSGRCGLIDGGRELAAHLSAGVWPGATRPVEAISGPHAGAHRGS